MQANSELTSTIEHYPYPAYLKEADTGKFIVSNVNAAQRWGLHDPNGFIGLTLHDMPYAKTPWGARHASMISELDVRVRHTKNPVLSRHPFLDANGDAQWVEIIKSPALGMRQALLGIATYRRDLTDTLSYAQVFDLYREFYGAPQAIRRTLAYLGIEQCFAVQPTEAPFRILLHKADRYSHKQVARMLGISHRTVDFQIDVLRNQVVDGDLARVLSLIRRRSA